MSGSRGHTDIPGGAGAFLGRRTELREIESLLLSGSCTRLLTLVGPGGIGKTRLAVEALRNIRDSAQCAVHWSRLARLAPGADTGAIAEEVVRSAVKADIAGRSAWDTLLAAFGDEGELRSPARRVVLLMDNCEHLLEGVVPLIADLLEALPGLTVMATSREPLGWADERIVVVPPLTPTQALELFRYGAELTGRPIPEDPEQRAIAEQICRHVDNNPLFIRLAAARLRYRPPAVLLRELTGDRDDQRLHWSHSVSLGAEERHSGVRDVLAWSYLLCTDGERILLARLSVFAAGFETEAVETRASGAEFDAIVAVCADHALSASSVEEMLERLVDRSLVRTSIRGTKVRYFLPESVRVFAAERLRDHRGGSDERQLRARHRRYYRDRVVAGHTVWYGPDEQHWIDWARAAADNILLGIETGLTDPAEAVIALETATILMSLRFPYGASRAITTLTEQALEVTRDTAKMRTGLWVTAAAFIGWIALWQGKHTYTAQLLDECVAVWVTDSMLHRDWRGRADRDIGLPATVELTWGLELMAIHLDPRALDVLARARRKFAAVGDRLGEDRSELFEALACSVVGEPERALALSEQHLHHARASGAGFAISWAELAVVLAQSRHGDRHEALRLGRVVLERLVAIGDRQTAGWLIHYCMMARTYILADQLATVTGDPDEVRIAATEIATLQGGIATLHRSLGLATDKVPLAAGETRQAIEVATLVLGEEGYEAAARRGAGLRPERDELQLFALGRHKIDETPTGRRAAQPINSRWEELSPAEREVALLAAAGWPNSAIATRRGSSIRTVDAQVASIRTKLMITARSDIISHIPDELDGLVQHESERRPARK
ncbi:ATP-binding protein [Nocardia iowensis]|uniref:LuxR C-terminal-related transcriptional regulator n=1 Tax=Nocardia iowensis TaxID=204891 RepID=A0ABX8S0I0_NOCIO|nr:AAA family ATPase [Nocardia iowensis]QXN94707.1 LuxR C-terminal-related transcriptional regulator [Nocardia iowensis]